MAPDRITVEDVVSLIRQQLGPKLPADAELGPQSELEDLGLSSLDQAELFLKVEEEVALELDPTVAADVTTLGEFVAVLNEQIAHQTPAQAPGAAT